MVDSWTGMIHSCSYYRLPLLVILSLPMMYRLHKEGKLYVASAIIITFVCALLLVFFFSIFTIILFALCLAGLTLMLIFFRNPKRLHVVRDTDLIMAPADGKVVVIEKTYEPEYLKAEVIQVSIFMSPVECPF
jgi:phosphatidylserine decarboxylase